MLPIMRRDSASHGCFEPHSFLYDKLLENNFAKPTMHYVMKGLLESIYFKIYTNFCFHLYECKVFLNKMRFFLIIGLLKACYKNLERICFKYYKKMYLQMKTCMLE